MTSIFIKSWLNDLGWLSYSLKFLEANWDEPDTEVVLVLDENCRNKTNFSSLTLPVRIHYVEPWPDGYSHAMFTKTCADQFCQGEYILLTDSDCMLLEPADRQKLMWEDKPLITYVTYEEHLKMYPNSPWRKITERLMDQPAELHFMAHCATLYRRDTFLGLRDYLAGLHDVPYEKLVYSGVPFDPKNFNHHPISLMDYDLLGAFAHIYQPDLYTFKHANSVPPDVFIQFHSWTKTPELSGLARRLETARSHRAREHATNRPLRSAQ
jgi:hypothetical protein